LVEAGSFVVGAGSLVYKFGVGPSHDVRFINAGPKKKSFRPFL